MIDPAAQLSFGHAQLHPIVDPVSRLRIGYKGDDRRRDRLGRGPFDKRGEVELANLAAGQGWQLALQRAAVVTGDTTVDLDRTRGFSYVVTCLNDADDSPLGVADPTVGARVWQT